MLGGEQETGFVQMSLKDIFDYRSSVREEQTIKVYVSYLEIYNENLIDLLNPKGDHSQLRIAEDEKVQLHQQLGIVIKGLRQQKVKTIDEALHLLRFGEEYRVAVAHRRSTE